jgi:D-alanyl-D-alanine carboxypeptidase
MRAIVIGLFFLIAAGNTHAAGTARGNPDIALDGQRIDALIAAYMGEHEVPGMSLAIVQAPYITRASGYGISDVRRDTLVAVNTMFDIGQMRNAFSAVAAMQLVEEGKLDLAAVLPLVRNPGEAATLEAMIGEASGQSYEAFVRRRQFEPLRLQHTRFASEMSTEPGENIQRGERHRRFLADPSFIDPAERAAGSRAGSESRAIYASASDISFWDIALAGDVLIRDPALRKLLYEPPISGDGAKNPSSGPWYFPGHPGLMIATGDRNGFSSLLARFTNREELICVTLLANREGLDLTQLARNIAGAYNRRTGPPAKAAGMRAQQSPFGAAETLRRFEEARSRTGAAAVKAVVWEEEGAVWIGVPDSGDADLHRVVDRMLLEAAGAALPPR